MLIAVLLIADMLRRVTVARPITCACLFALAAALPVAITGCGPKATDGGFDSPNPAAKMYAIEQAARVGDTSAVQSIIEQLNSDDPAVRMLAISALQRLTGQTYGYRHYDDAAQRSQAIARWVAAYDSGEITARIRSMNEHPTAAHPADLPETQPVTPASRVSHVDQG